MYWQFGVVKSLEIQPLHGVIAKIGKFRAFFSASQQKCCSKHYKTSANKI